MTHNIGPTTKMTYPGTKLQALSTLSGTVFYAWTLEKIVCLVVE